MSHLDARLKGVFVLWIYTHTKEEIEHILALPRRIEGDGGEMWSDDDLDWFLGECRNRVGLPREL